jgi:hypothetical protein
MLTKRYWRLLVLLRDSGGHNMVRKPCQGHSCPLSTAPGGEPWWIWSLQTRQWLERRFHGSWVLWNGQLCHLTGLMLGSKAAVHSLRLRPRFIHRVFDRRDPQKEAV